jgi:Tfp pilus assembly protein PilX
MSITQKQAPVPNKQSGMVAIMIVIILMIVISLIVLGFAQISRRNQRQSLDRQLSTQAFYAAETGVNDTANLLKTAGVPTAKTSCSDNGGGYYLSLPTSTIDATNKVSYTCLMVDPTPPALVYSDVGSSSTIVPIGASGGASIATLTLTWKSKTGVDNPSSNCPTGVNNVFTPATAAWTCGYGVLRFDIVPTTGALNQATLQSRTFTSFLVPVKTAAPANISYPATINGSNDLVAASCSDTSCTATITGLSATQYYMRISSIYTDVSLQITGTSGAGGAVNFVGAQAVIDSTGKAQDVLRRIQVRVPLSGSSTNLLSDDAIMSTDSICKRFEIMDGSGGAPGFFRSSAGLGGTNPLCQ